MAVDQVRANPPVREQPPILKDIADAPRLGRQVDALAEQGAIADTDLAAVGTQQPSDHVQDTRLARPRRAEQRGEAGAGRAARGDQAGAASPFDLHLKRHGPPARHGCGEPAPPTGPAPRAQPRPPAARAAPPPPPPPPPPQPTT